MAKAQAESIDSALAPLREAMAPPKPTAADDAMLRLAQYEADAAIGQLKSAGSAAFKTGDFVRAVQFWEKAAQLTKSQTEQSVLFSNMSAASCATAQGLILAGFVVFITVQSETQPRRSRDAAEMQPRCSRDEYLHASRCRSVSSSSRTSPSV